MEPGPVVALVAIASVDAIIWTGGLNRSAVVSDISYHQLAERHTLRDVRGIGVRRWPVLIGLGVAGNGLCLPPAL